MEVVCHFIGPFSFYYREIQSDVTGHNIWYDRFIKDKKFSLHAKFRGYSWIPDAAIIFFLIFTILPCEPCLNMLE